MCSVGKPRGHYHTPFVLTKMPEDASVLPTPPEVTSVPTTIPEVACMPMMTPVPAPHSMLSRHQCLSHSPCLRHSQCICLLQSCISCLSKALGQSSCPSFYLYLKFNYVFPVVGRNSQNQGHRRIPCYGAPE